MSSPRPENKKLCFSEPLLKFVLKFFTARLVMSRTVNVFVQPGISAARREIKMTPYSNQSGMKSLKFLH